MDAPGRPFIPRFPTRKGSSAVIVEDVKTAYPEMTPERLECMPEDQLLFFWGDSARFTLTEPATTRPWRDSYTTPLIKPGELMYRQSILDVDGKNVGQTGFCQAGHDAGASRTGECEFVLIAENNLPPEYFAKPEEFEEERMNTVLQIGRCQDGVAYRINIAEICQKAWARAKVTRGLVVLGTEKGLSEGQ